MLYDNPVKQVWRACGGLAIRPHIAHMKLARTSRTAGATRAFPASHAGDAVREHVNG